MCVVSMAYDFARTIPKPAWTPDTYDQFKELIKRLDEIDKKLGLPDCHDPKKAEFIKDIEDRLKRLEEMHSPLYGYPGATTTPGC